MEESFILEETNRVGEERYLRDMHKSCCAKLRKVQSAGGKVFDMAKALLGEVEMRSTPSAVVMSKNLTEVLEIKQKIAHGKMNAASVWAKECNIFEI